MLFIPMLLLEAEFIAMLRILSRTKMLCNAEQCKAVQDPWRHSSIVGSKPLSHLCGQNSNVASAFRPFGHSQTAPVLLIWCLHWPLWTRVPTMNVRYGHGVKRTYTEGYRRVKKIFWHYCQKLLWLVLNINLKLQILTLNRIYCTQLCIDRRLRVGVRNLNAHVHLIFHIDYTFQFTK